jgi:hypothetical protein
MGVWVTLGDIWCVGEWFRVCRGVGEGGAARRRWCLGVWDFGGGVRKVLDYFKKMADDEAKCAETKGE